MRTKTIANALLYLPISVASKPEVWLAVGRVYDAASAGRVNAVAVAYEKGRNKGFVEGCQACLCSPVMGVHYTGPQRRVENDPETRLHHFQQ